jgi:hypothetical protein
LLNKKGTKLFGGQISSGDVGGGDNADCSVQGGFTAER